MPDLDEQLLAFGRWLDAEIERHAAEPPVYVRPARRRSPMWLAVAAVAATLAGAVALGLVARRDVPDPRPGGPGTFPATTTSTISVVEPTTTAAAPGPAASAVPASSPAPPSAVPSTAAPSTTPAPTTAPTTAGPSDPTSTAPTTTTAAPVPIPDTPSSAPATPAPTTDPASACLSDVRPVKRVGTVSFRACADGIHLVVASVVTGWTATPEVQGPPSVTVRFTNATGPVYTCTITGTIDSVSFSGDC